MSCFKSCKQVAENRSGSLISYSVHSSVCLLTLDSSPQVSPKSRGKERALTQGPKWSRGYLGSGPSFVPSV